MGAAGLEIRDVESEDGGLAVHQVLGVARDGDGTMLLTSDRWATASV